MDSELKNQKEFYEPILILQDENGKEENFYLLDIIEYDGNQYVVMISEEDKENDLVTIYQVIEKSEEEDLYSAVTDEEILETVFKIFEARMDFKDIEI